MLEDMNPVDIGLPSFYRHWRNIQKEAVEHALYSNKRFGVYGMPTGSGKSLFVMTLAQIWTDKRFVILTGTKGLQKQYATGFNPDHSLAQAIIKLGGKPENLVTDMRGRNNYDCSDVPGYKCDRAWRVGCIHTGSNKCEYGAHLDKAQQSRIVVTNYKWWMYAQDSMRGKALSHLLKPLPIDVLVLDEAHLAPNELASFLSMTIGEQECRDLLGTIPPHTEDIKTWVAFSNAHRVNLNKEITRLNDQIHRAFIGGRRVGTHLIREVERSESLLEKLQRLAKFSAQWVCEQKQSNRTGRYWQMDCLWPGMFSESSLFYGIPKVLLISATVRPKTLSLLGVKGHLTDFKEWDRVFPPQRAPIYHVPTVRLNRNASKNDYDTWVNRIDEIIESRLDRKGIIHTVSYDRQKIILERSMYSHLMFANTEDPNSPNATTMFEQFLKAPAPAVLCSPSFGTGWDFPGPAAEYQIISKIPFVNHTSKIMVERAKKDPTYGGYLAMQELVQQMGRVVRSEFDRGETFIIDDAVGFFMSQNSHNAPSWFQKRGIINKILHIPTAPPPLNEDPVYLRAQY